ncbi:MAG TPA: 50S ribosomal protein L29 [Candidatus Nanoarchaeia archaeon]|nr:50S ribosomal protein L29 [Candidatus Nanoarchaeia archaeon]
MANTKSKELGSLNREDKERKLKELNMELIKARVSSRKSGSAKIRRAKRAIAKILTLNKSNMEVLKDK